MGAKDLCNDPLCDRNRRGERHAAHDTSPIHQKKIGSLQKLIGAGSDIPGAAIGGIGAAALGGPPGAVAGAAAGAAISNVLKNIGNDISECMLSPREKVRIGAAYSFAFDKIQANFKNGHKLRDDDFFVDKPSYRAAYKEIV
jgi:hypothetical protein